MSIALIKNNHEIIKKEVIPFTLISDLVKEYNLSMPCGGNHTCGKCKVIAKGEISELTDNEKRFLSQEEIKKGIRLCCFAKVIGDCEIEIIKKEKDNTQVLIEGKEIQSDFKGVSIICDIGTTTIAAYLYENNELINAIGEHNNQEKYGADVITRISHTPQCDLQLIILNQLNDIFDNLVNGRQKEVSKIIITGNTTMLHFLFGYDAKGIAVFPFTPHSLFDIEVDAKDFFQQYENARLYCPPCISAYLGADIVCSILASGMLGKKDEASLLVDIGTNGEMALYHKGVIYGCSTAAGPALEGATIKCGTVAKNGAITKAYFREDKTFSFETIGNEEPNGICGSGLISIVALLLRENIIDETGLLNEESEAVSIDGNETYVMLYQKNNIIITQQDIRQFQLAKSAIISGIKTMLCEAKCSEIDIDKFYICGGFGSYIDRACAGEVSLIPMGFIPKTEALGNAAAMGARLLVNEEAREKARRLVEEITAIELSESPIFMEEYITNMGF